MKKKFSSIDSTQLRNEWNGRKSFVNLVFLAASSSTASTQGYDSNKDDQDNEEKCVAIGDDGLLEKMASLVCVDPLTRQHKRVSITKVKVNKLFYEEDGIAVDDAALVSDLDAKCYMRSDDHKELIKYLVNNNIKYDRQHSPGNHCLTDSKDHNSFHHHCHGMHHKSIAYSVM